MPPKADQKLPASDYGSFQKIVAHYEKREYPKALKKADQLLAKYPNHGETLAMKGLVLLNMDASKKEDAKKLIKAGVAANMFSHVVWHVYGMLYRAERLYEDAMKCYQRALANDPGNAQILKDLGTLQIQRRNLPGFTETRRQLLMQKSNNRNNWLAYAIGTHLSGQHGKALGIMDSYVATETDFDKRRANYEDSEILLYRNQIIEESGQLPQALEHLNSIEKRVVDKMAWREKKASLLLRLDKHAEAEREYRALLATNIENMAYHLALRLSLRLEPATSPAHKQLAQSATASASPATSTSMSCAHVTYSPEQRTALAQLYAQLSEQYPRAATVRRMPLDFVVGEEFESRVDKYLRNGIRKGIPSLFRDLCPLYVDSTKAQTIEKKVLSFLKHLQEKSSFDESGAFEAPSALLWTLYYLGQHYDHLGQYAEALKYTEQGISHTPTAIDFYVLKARIHKHSGDYKNAHIHLDAARQMDLADRYLNTKCVRYAMRAGDFEKGLETVALFLKDQEGPLASLFDMQVSWFANAAADLYYRKKEYGPAIRYYHNTHSYFETMIEDQFDFHAYCLRKTTLRAYVQMLRFEDNIMAHRFYRHAAQQLVRSYMAVAQSRQGWSEEDMKKEMERLDANIATREAKRKEEREKAKQKKKDESEKEPEKKEALEDVDGNLLLKTKDPLAEAGKYLKNLQLYCPEDVETHLLAAQYYTMKKQPTEVAKALKAILALDGNNSNQPEVHVAVASFLQTASEESKADVQELSGGQSVSAFNQAFLNRNAKSLAHRLAAARVMVSLDGAAAVADVVAIKEDDERPTTQVLLSAYEFLRDVVKNPEALQAFVTKAHQLSPLTPAFLPQA